MKTVSDKNTATSAVVGFAGVIYYATLQTASAKLPSDKEYLTWSQCTRARVTKIWRGMELILLVKFVKMGTDICATQVELDAVCMMV